jgi:hypothetical protein
MHALNDKRIPATDVFQYADKDVALAEDLRLAGGEFYAYGIRNAFRKLGVAGPGQNRKVAGKDSIFE